MKFRSFGSNWKHLALILAVAGMSVTQLTGCGGCGGVPVPIRDITLPIASNITLPAVTDASGTAQVGIGEVCDLFSEEDLDALVRQQAGDAIADRVSLNAVELKSVNVMTVGESTFSPFTSANLSLDVTGGETIDMGSAMNASGLGTSFSLTRDEPLELIEALGGDDCVSPILTLEGAGANDVETATFTVEVVVDVILGASLF